MRTRRRRPRELGALDSGAPAALWAIYDATGVRPEYQLPTYWVESGFDASTPNKAGAPYYGINQISGSQLARQGIAVADYLTWSASEQLEQVVLPFVRSNVAYVGAAPASGVRFYQMNFLPGTMKTATSLGSIVAVRGTAAYTANAGLDFLHQGAITLASLAHFVGVAAASSPVQAAIAACYALRPSEAPPRDPVYGTDFFDPLLTSAVTAGILTLVATLAQEFSR